MRTLVRTRRSYFVFEPLEPRTMLAGDVTVSVEGGDLVVLGDDNANRVLIEGTGVAGGYLIDSPDTNLFFNGQLQGGAFLVTEAFGNIIVDLHGGDDFLLISNLTVDKLIVDTDEGDDFVILGPFAEAAGLLTEVNGGIDDGDEGPLPTGPEVDNDNLIDNDVPPNTIGHFELLVGPAGDSTEGGFTAQGRNLLFVNENFIFEYFGYIDIGEAGEGQLLSDTTITQEPELIDDDVVESRGFFFGDSEQRIDWVATTSIADGDNRITTTITFTVDTPDGEEQSAAVEPQQEGPTLGDLRFISYLDEDVAGASDDIMFLSGTPGETDFKVFTVDNQERVGFAHGGIYSEGPGLVNAQWKGWAADEFDDLQAAITGGGASYSEAGNIDATSLPPGVDAEVGPFFGPEDVTTAFAWRVDAAATTATVTFFIEFVPGEDDEFDPGDLEGSVGVNELLAINTDGGNDVVATVRVFGDATWDINLGDESLGESNLTDDHPFNELIEGVPLNDQAFIFIASGGDIDINGGTGDDLVNINYLTANGTLVVDGVSGNDVVSVNGSVFNDDVVLLGGSGNDTVAVDFSRQDGGSDAVLVIDSGADNDFVLFARSLFTEEDVYIVTGGGSDRVVVGLYYADVSGNLATGGNVVRTLSMDTGGENDTADIRANVVEELFGAFGGGDDSVTVAFNHVTSDDTVSLDGGGGFDSLSAGGNIFGDHVHIHSFEELIDLLFGDGSSPGLPQ
jgi:hypothetical protein